MQNKERAVPMWVDYDYSAELLLLLTQKDLRVVDIRRGTVKNIYC
jgi:hypothetical protein